MYHLIIYQTSEGKQPFKAWRDKLRKKDPRAVLKINSTLDKVENGNFSDHKFERSGVWEIRINYGPGYRLYYSVENGKIVLLLIGGDKTTQSRDIAKAVEYLKDYKARTK
ncbi:type II toxin-antitoxin system RelE/ParE family toxin [Mixta gaviniae]|uniref:Addiction module killer protein n=1 Tax=Mixta gaviniae TaxID=665914 RepID=A0A1X1DY64_9GAMM|nr:type II toxin-antitoxin system RelE/ParE family toxin [Mixta gaviniae]AUX92520.1 addiction module killer protein [Mixta gaviniae]ORM81607.1 addiction module killer protein [Mixta gaviniae]